MDLIVNNYLIDTPIEEILKEVRLETNGIYLDYIGENNDGDVKIQCPFHANGHERHPSCHIFAKKDDPKIYYGTVHCLAAGTKVITDMGLKNIEDLVDTPTNILNGEGNWEQTVFKCYGESRLFQINLTRDRITKTLYATDNHEWFIHRGGTKLTKELSNKDILTSCYPSPKDFQLIDEAVIHGIIFADGTKYPEFCRRRDKVNPNKRIVDKSVPVSKYTYAINFSYNSRSFKPNLTRFFENNALWRVKKHVLRENRYYDSIVSNRISIDYKSLPLITSSRDYKMSFLAGYFSCDGSIVGKSFSTVDKSIMDGIRDLFVSCGVSIRDLTTSIRPVGTTYLLDRESILYTTKIIFETLPEKFFINGESGVSNKKYLRGRWRVTGVVPTDRIEKVYCCETSTQSFVIDENILTHNCFTCGKKVPLYTLVGHCFGQDDDFGKDWLAKKFGTIYIEPDSVFTLKLEKHHTTDDVLNAINNDYNKKTIDESVLDKMSNFHPYMVKRKLTKEVVDKFKIKYDNKTNSIVFPVWDEYDNLVSLTRRSVDKKRFNLESNKNKPVYLLNYIIKDHINSRVMITESQINALTGWTYGIPSVALFGTGTSRQYKILETSGIHRFLLAFDGDDAGRKGRDRFVNYFKHKKGFSISYLTLPEGKDVNDISKEEFFNLQETIVML